MQVPDRDEAFTNHGVFHPAVRAAVFVVTYLVIFAALFVPAAIVTQAVGPDVDVTELLRDPQRPFFLVVAWILLIAALVAVFGLVVSLDGQPHTAVGLWLHRGWARECLAGLGLGTVLIAVVFGVLVAAGLAHPAPAGGGYARALLLGVVLLAPMALSEELVFRGYLQRNLVQGFGAWPGLLVTAAIFGFGHFGNPEVGAIGFVNIAIAGVLMGYPYLRSGSLWLPFGLHFAWNFTQSSVLGMPVSGIGLPGLLETSLRKPTWISGGPFGPEGSVVATAAMLGGLAYLVWRYRHADPALAQDDLAEEPGGDAV